MYRIKNKYVCSYTGHKCIIIMGSGEISKKKNVKTLGPLFFQVVHKLRKLIVC